MSFGFTLSHLFRGLSSTVRRCIDRENSSECAVKIIDIFSAGSDSNEEAEALTEEYFNEVSILRKLCDEPGHANISELYNVFHDGPISVLLNNIGAVFDPEVTI